MGRVREEKRREEKRRRKKIKKEKVSEEKEDPGARKVGKSRNIVFFPVICGSGGSKSMLAKVAGAEPSGQMRDAKLQTVVARSTFGSQNAQNTPGPDHFWKLRCRKSARRCGAKHISKSKCTKQISVGPLLEVVICRKSAHCCGVKHISESKCTKHISVGPLLEVVMSKKCTLLWHEAHFQVKSYGALLDIQMSFRVAGARDCAPCQK